MTSLSTGTAIAPGHRMSTLRPSHRHSSGASAQSALDVLARVGARPAPALPPDEAALVRALDPLLAQVVRAGRETVGAVRAFASLIEDAEPEHGNVHRWAGKIVRATHSFDEFTVRFGALRLCEDEPPARVQWGEILSCVAGWSARLAGDACAIQVRERTDSEFYQRGELIARMLFQLVRNAVESRPNSRRVVVSVDEARENEGPRFHVRVSDDGSGVRPQYREEIWRPFVTTKPHQAGLGLAYVAVVASLVGATIGMRSEPGKGTTVHVLLDAATPRGPRADRSPASRRRIRLTD